MADEQGTPGGRPGDLGRRVRERRLALGLSSADVAERAGMDPGYVDYVERKVSSVSGGALLRLAAALETTADALSGGSIERPPGSARASRSPELAELSNNECVRLLADGGIGRVVIVTEEGPSALPVNFRLLEGDVVFRTVEDGVIDRTIGAEGTTIGFEVDHLDDALAEGWSVLIRGHARPVSDADELGRLRRLELEAWAGGERQRYVSLAQERVTGRRIRTGR